MEDHNQKYPDNNNQVEEYEPKGNSPWRILLSIAVTIYFVIKIANTCSGNKSASSAQDEQFNNMMRERQTEFQDSYVSQRSHLEKASNEVMYSSYKSLNDMPSEKKTAYKIIKIEKDTAISFDIETKLKIKKGSYFQRNNDDSLKMAMKTPGNLSIFVHDFNGSGDLKYNFLNIKKGKSLKNLKDESLKEGKSKMFSYEITRNDTIFNGFAWATKAEEFFVFFEFESNKLTKEQVKLEAYLYLIENFKAKK